MDNEMIERVAEAIYNDTKSNYKEFEPYSELYPRTKSIYIMHARAAIKVMREPTEKMTMAGCECNPTQWNKNTDLGFAADVANAVWIYMIDAILND